MRLLTQLSSQSSTAGQPRSSWKSLVVLSIFIATCSTLALLGYFKFHCDASHTRFHCKAPRSAFTCSGSSVEDCRRELENVKLLSEETVSNVEKFVVFVGYPRSGSSITGSLLDAHPNAVIAHEFYLFTKLRDKPELISSKRDLFNELYVNSYLSMLEGWRNSKANTKGYSLEVEGLYQGQFNHTLKVIGDKTAGDTANLFDLHPWLSHTPYYKRLQQTVGIPLYIIHVIRNPFDLIATSTMYVHEARQAASKAHKLYDPVRTKMNFHSVFRKAAAVQRLKSLQLPVLDVHLVDLVTMPVETMKSICAFLDLTCSQDYLHKCEEKVFGSLSKSRELIDWPHGLKEQVEREQKKYPFFSRYSYL